MLNNQIRFPKWSIIFSRFMDDGDDDDDDDDDQDGSTNRENNRGEI